MSLPPSVDSLLSSCAPLCRSRKRDPCRAKELGLAGSHPWPSCLQPAPGTCLKAPRLSTYSKPQCPSGQLGWQPCQPQATFLPMQPDVGAREGHISPSLESKAQIYKNKISTQRSVTRTVKTQLSPHGTPWGHWLSLQGWMGLGLVATKGTEVAKRNIILESPPVPPFGTATSVQPSDSSAR